ncbi:SPOR domain-containing protein [Sphingomonas glaciei]|uniref:SPOR domain-containing protein n=1 Tax=Sphingomonas glaciei TaxID=2938948 RepID=A0ABY5MWS2_9SPHN|nr:SPOR domain-containing protein [Sphingomonas glaciei]UUR07787.1 SPOR domain-containing protein [Sphingomonas glaciei]
MATRGGLSRGGTAGEPLPWLEPVEDEDEPPALSARKMGAAILVVLLAAALVAGTLYWIGRSGADEGTGAPELIRAEPGPVKIKPDDPGGIDVAGDSETAFATGAGETVDGELNLDAVPEEAIARPNKAKPAPAAEEPAEPTAAAPPPPAGSANQVQLGFYGSASEAEAAWKTLSGRFPAIAGAGKIVIPYQSGQRLRAGFASPAEARAACQLLKAAGDACFVAR